MSDAHESRPGSGPEDNESPDGETPEEATQRILDRAAAERQEIAEAHAPAGDAEPVAKQSAWEKVRGEIVDPSWRTIVVVLSTSGVSLILGLVLVFSYQR